jgi:hypothetical protein
MPDYALTQSEPEEPSHLPEGRKTLGGPFARPWPLPMAGQPTLRERVMLLNSSRKSCLSDDGFRHKRSLRPSAD